MHQRPQNIEQILNNPSILIYFDVNCNGLYITITKLYVFQLFEQFLFLTSRQSRFSLKKSGLGKNIH